LVLPPGLAAIYGESKQRAWESRNHELDAQHHLSGHAHAEHAHGHPRRHPHHALPRGACRAFVRIIFLISSSSSRLITIIIIIIILIIIITIIIVIIISP
jgi:hypothetical protein